MQVNPNTIVDLEFNKVLEQVSGYAFLDATKNTIQGLLPIQDSAVLIQQLNATNEYLASLQNQNAIPYSEHFILQKSLSRLHIENYHLPADDFLKIKSNCLQIKAILLFFHEFAEYYPTWNQIVHQLEYQSQIAKQIDTVFNRHGEVKDNATAVLEEIRRSLKSLNARITKQFNGALSRYSEFLDDIKESVIDNTRVLAVKAVHRKKIKGRFLGSSKTGSIAFIQPDIVIQSQRELEELLELEKKEITKILIYLTQQIASFKDLIFSYEELLNQLDFTQAKAQYAQLIQGILPNLVQNATLCLKQAYHPLLLLKNKAQNKKTIPQDITLHPEQRIIIISGPNAGGKSITLKTIGLLQLMLQSGLLIPVHPKSQVGFFSRILTDIGDNQSIENQLSTYSYRLKQMAYFLRKTQPNTLLLIDEFGTGSDPDLGGALAEVFFEEFYNTNCYGIFTTHYTNIKLKAEELPQAINACMLFDEKSLEPLYKLEIGQAGSSFTFEVAEKNHIPYRLINRAKKKVEGDKVRLDKTILKLQQEKFQLQKTKNKIESIKEDSAEHQKKIEHTEGKLQQKLLQFQNLYDTEQKKLNIGQKILDLANEYHQNKNKKTLVTKFLKLIEIENSKATQPSKQHKKVAKILNKELQKQQHNIKDVQHKIKEQQAKQAKEKAQNLKIGDRVKIINSSSVGTVESIENQTISINYGMFRAKVSIFDVTKIQ